MWLNILSIIFVVLTRWSNVLAYGSNLVLIIHCLSRSNFNYLPLKMFSRHPYDIVAYPRGFAYPRLKTTGLYNTSDHVLLGWCVDHSSRTTSKRTGVTSWSTRNLGEGEAETETRSAVIPTTHWASFYGHIVPGTPHWVWVVFIPTRWKAHHYVQVRASNFAAKWMAALLLIRGKYRVCVSAWDIYRAPPPPASSGTVPQISVASATDEFVRHAARALSCANKMPHETFQ
jgi:hypothetical protein